MNNQPHKGQLRRKIIKGKGISIGKAKDMGGIGKEKEKNTRRKCLKNNARHKNEQVQNEP